MNARQSLVVVVSFLVTLILGAAIADAQGPRPGGKRAPAALAGTAFTYQGQLKKSSALLTSTCNFQFGLWDAASAGAQVGATQTVSSLAVTNGLFTTPIDFGSGAFTGDARWMQSRVQCTGDGTFTTLDPRQALNPSPMAFALPGLYTQQNTTSPNLIGGYSGNSVTAGVVGASIGGGGQSSLINRVTDDYGTVGGGQFNRAGDDAGLTTDTAAATVGGGVSNKASSMYATVSGGFNNTASNIYATVSGGQNNTASGSTTAIAGGALNTASGYAATVGGGYGNAATGPLSVVGGGGARSCGEGCLLFDGNTASGLSSFIGGGFDNNASGNFATIPGGYQNSATMSHTLAAGRRAKANHDGAFVWGDSTDADVASTGNDQFVVRAAGGMRIPGAGVGANTFVFIHQVTSSSSVSCINHPLTNNDPNAILIITQNWNPGGTGGVSNNDSVGVIYGTGSNQWCIFNQSGASIPINAAFNVLVFKP